MKKGESSRGTVVHSLQFRGHSRLIPVNIEWAGRLCHFTSITSEHKDILPLDRKWLLSLCHKVLTVVEQITGGLVTYCGDDRRVPKSNPLGF